MKKSPGTVSRWGNSLAVRLPRHVAKAAGLREGDGVDIHSEDSVVIIRRAKPHYDIDDLVAGITPENVHPAVDWGAAVGRERFWEQE